MKFLTWLLLLLLLFVVFGVDRRSRRRVPFPAEKFFYLRVTLLSGFLTGLFVVALLVLPFPWRILIIIPAAGCGALLANVWRSGRARLERTRAARTAFDEARRLN